VAQCPSSRCRGSAFDDAIHATRAAIAEGVVPGAGLALLRAIPAVDAEAARLEGDERSGAQILRRALEAPARQIAENSGVDGGVVVDKMRTGTRNPAFAAPAGKYVDLIEAGIIDPTKVVRVALENAVSLPPSHGCEGCRTTSPGDACRAVNPQAAVEGRPILELRPGSQRRRQPRRRLNGTIAIS